jgi:hypothetical protein
MIWKRKEMRKRVVIGGVVADVLLMAQRLVFELLDARNLLHQALQNKQCHISANATSICVGVRQSVLFLLVTTYRKRGPFSSHLGFVCFACGLRLARARHQTWRPTILVKTNASTIDSDCCRRIDMSHVLSETKRRGRHGRQG